MGVKFNKIKNALKAFASGTRDNIGGIDTEKLKGNAIKGLKYGGLGLGIVTTAPVSLPAMAIYKNREKIKEGFNDFGIYIDEKASSMGSAIKGAAINLGNGIVNKASELKNYASTKIDSATQGIKDFGNSLNEKAKIAKEHRQNKRDYRKFGEEFEKFNNRVERLSELNEKQKQNTEQMTKIEEKYSRPGHIDFQDLNTLIKEKIGLKNELNAAKLERVEVQNLTATKDKLQAKLDKERGKESSTVEDEQMLRTSKKANKLEEQIAEIEGKLNGRTVESIDQKISTKKDEIKIQDDKIIKEKNDLKENIKSGDKNIGNIKANKIINDYETAVKRDSDLQQRIDQKQQKAANNLEKAGKAVGAKSNDLNEITNKANEKLNKINKYKESSENKGTKFVGAISRVGKDGFEQTMKDLGHRLNPLELSGKAQREISGNLTNSVSNTANETTKNNLQSQRDSKSEVISMNKDLRKLEDYAKTKDGKKSEVVTSGLEAANKIKEIDQQLKTADKSTNPFAKDILLEQKAEQQQILNTAIDQVKGHKLSFGAQIKEAAHGVHNALTTNKEIGKLDKQITAEGNKIDAIKQVQAVAQKSNLEKATATHAPSTKNYDAPPPPSAPGQAQNNNMQR